MGIKPICGECYWVWPLHAPWCSDDCRPAILGALFLSGCALDVTPDDNTRTYKDVLQVCAQCHKDTSALLSDSVSKACPGEVKVAPGNPEKSVLVHALRGDWACIERMPKGMPALSDEDVAIVEQWISEGAVK